MFEVFFFRFRFQSRQTLARGRLDPRGRRETRQKRLVALAGVPADDAAHRRVRLERRGVNRDGLTRQPAGLDESLLHPRKDGPVRLQIDQAPRARNRRMIGWRLVHGQPQKAADRQRGRRAPRHPAFRVDAFEVADQQQAEVAPGCQARSAHHGRVEPVTQAFDEPIEVVPVEQRRQPRVERMARRGGQVRRRDPQRRLIRLARSHSHARQCSTTDRLCRSLITPTFTTGCYGLSALLTLVQVGLLAPPVFDAVSQGLALPDEVARLTHGGLLIMLPWTGAIGYRRFRQGLLIRSNLTRRVA